jgi:hypothetical protein
MGDREAQVGDARLEVVEEALLERLFGEERRRMKIVANGLRRASGPEADVRGVDPCFGELARPPDQAVRHEALEAVGAELDAECRRHHEPTKTPSERVSPSENPAEICGSVAAACDQVAVTAASSRRCGVWGEIVDSQGVPGR